MFVAIRDVRADPGPPVQGIQGLQRPLAGAVEDRAAIALLVEAGGGETGTSNGGGQTLQSRAILGGNCSRAVDPKSGGRPGAQLLGELRTESMPGHPHLQDPVLEQAAESRGVEAVDRDLTAVPIPGRVADQPMEVSVRSQVVSPGLDSEDGPGNRAGPQAAGDVVSEAGPGAAAELSQELTVFAEGRA